MWIATRIPLDRNCGPERFSKLKSPSLQSRKRQGDGILLPNTPGMLNGFRELFVNFIKKSIVPAHFIARLTQDKQKPDMSIIPLKYDHSTLWQSFALSSLTTQAIIFPCSLFDLCIQLVPSTHTSHTYTSKLCFKQQLILPLVEESKSNSSRYRCDRHNNHQYGDFGQKICSSRIAIRARSDNWWKLRQIEPREPQYMAAG